MYTKYILYYIAITHGSMVILNRRFISPVRRTCSRPRLLESSEYTHLNFFVLSRITPKVTAPTIPITIIARPILPASSSPFLKRKKFDTKAVRSIK